PDLEHWPAFPDSFDQMIDLLEDVMRGHTRVVAFLSGDVHFSYNMKGRLAAEPARPVYQLVSSPTRNELTSGQVKLIRTLATPVGSALVEVGRALATAFTGTSAFLPPSPQSAEQKKRLDWKPLQAGGDWIWTGNFVASLRVSPALLEGVYE